ncbi:MAG: hypothetical protein DRI65_14975 [Chloroflexota bacterium]|nr:MAG: hypothetical protein DRI65_14975 [Chloroflexota bacterium]
MEISLKKLDKYSNRAKSIAEESHDIDTQVASLLINIGSGAVIADGFNGYVRGAPDNDLPKTRPDKYEYVVHAEINMICNAARHGISTNNCIVYVSISPCVQCMRMLYQAGIEHVYFKKKYHDFDKSIQMGDMSVKVRELDGFWHIRLLKFSKEEL